MRTFTAPGWEAWAVVHAGARTFNRRHKPNLSRVGDAVSIYATRQKSTGVELVTIAAAAWHDCQHPSFSNGVLVEDHINSDGHRCIAWGSDQTKPASLGIPVSHHVAVTTLKDAHLATGHCCTLDPWADQPYPDETIWHWQLGHVTQIVPIEDNSSRGLTESVPPLRTRIRLNHFAQQRTPE